MSGKQYTGPSSKSFPVKPTKVPSKLKSVGNSDFNYVTSNQIPKDQFTVFIASAPIKDALTFHRAIGFVDPAHHPDAWYCTRASEVQDLIHNRKNPAQTQLDAARQAHIQAGLVTLGHLQLVQGVACYPGDATASRRDILAAARRAVTADERERHGSQAFMHHLTDAQRGFEETISEALKTREDGTLPAIRAAALAAHPDTYRTRSGPSADKDQHIVPYLEGLSTEQAVARVRRRLMGLDP